jgi:hypothetical protein
MARAKPEVTEAKQRRFAELVARGATQHEAARAVGRSESSGEAWMTQPKVRQWVQEWKDKLAGKTNDLALINELLQSDDPKDVIAGLKFKQDLGILNIEGDLEEGSTVFYVVAKTPPKLGQ